MNLIEARKLAHEGWVRSETRTDGKWVQVSHSFLVFVGGQCSSLHCEDLEADNWEPKPKPFEADVWVSSTGDVESGAPHDQWHAEHGWRRIRVREVVE